MKKIELCHMFPAMQYIFEMQKTKTMNKLRYLNTESKYISYSELSASDPRERVLLVCMKAGK